MIKCIVCDSSNIKIFSINPKNGVAKTKCMSCGLTTNEVRKDVINPEIIYK